MKKLFMLLVVVVCLFVTQVLVQAGSVTLAWDPSTSNTVTGYKIYVKTDTTQYTTGIDVGKVLTYTVPNLAEGTKYYFVATAYTPGSESGYSNEVFATIPWAKPLPPNMKPIVSSISLLEDAQNLLGAYVDENRQADFPVPSISREKITEALSDIGTVTARLKRVKADGGLQLVMAE
jgi:hypothetical protein